MKLASKQLVALVALTTLTLSGCSSLSGRLDQAAVDTAIARADLHPAVMPKDCKTREPHASLKAGDEVRSVLKLERKALERANDRTIRCSSHAEKHFVQRPAE